MKPEPDSTAPMPGVTGATKVVGAAVAETDQSSRPPDDRNLNRREASTLLDDEFGIKLAVSTLAKVYCIRSDGPPVRHFGSKPMYQAGELRAWARARLSAPTRSSSERPSRAA